MKKHKVLMTYSLSKNYDNFLRFVSSIKSVQNFVVYILDLRETQQEPENVVLEADNIEVHYVAVDQENRDKIFQLTYNLAHQNQADFFTHIVEGTVFTKSLDFLLTDSFLDNSNVSIAIPDFRLQVNNSRKSMVQVLFKSRPANISNAPIAIFRNYPKEIAAQAEQNQMPYVDFLTRAFIVKHCPEVIADVLLK